MKFVSTVTGDTRRWSVASQRRATAASAWQGGAALRIGSINARLPTRQIAPVSFDHAGKELLPRRQRSGKP
jgi:hypothetical protein